jgi:hypothetical protein
VRRLTVNEESASKKTEAALQVAANVDAEPSAVAHACVELDQHTNLPSPNETIGIDDGTRAAARLGATSWDVSRWSCPNCSHRGYERLW